MATLDTVSPFFTVWETIEPLAAEEPVDAGFVVLLPEVDGAVAVVPLAGFAAGVLVADDVDAAVGADAAGFAGAGAELAAGAVPLAGFVEDVPLGERIWLTAASTLVDAGVASAAAA
ncbi:MAG: hypothetical protein NTY63_08465 [Candidatus Bipolaricaulota bacterium]|nr:hypothetical protein [Candidatus Bipolaricaulota bacterium]